MSDYHLASTSYRTTEAATPGSGRGGAIGSGGAPVRYEFTAASFTTISPYIETGYNYGMAQLNLGSNFISKLEVVSGLNAINLGTYTYHYNSNNCTTKYNPKIYLGTFQTIAAGWNYDTQKGINYPSIWPQNSSQKGEDYL